MNRWYKVVWGKKENQKAYFNSKSEAIDYANKNSGDVFEIKKVATLIYRK